MLMLHSHAPMHPILLRTRRQPVALRQPQRAPCEPASPPLHFQPASPSSLPALPSQFLTLLHAPRLPDMALSHIQRGGPTSGL